MLKSLIGLVVLVLSVFCFVQCDTNVKLSAPQKNPGDVILRNYCAIVLKKIFLMNEIDLVLVKIKTDFPFSRN